MSKTENVACEVIGRTPIKREDLLLKGITRGIYGLRNKITGKWYVGQSWDIANRWKGYSNEYCPNQRKLKHSLEKYGWESFESYVLEEVKCPSQIMLDRTETEWIKKLNTMENGYNLKISGGRGKFSEESKQKLKDAWARRKASGKPLFTDETRQRMSESHKGKKLSQSVIDSIKRVHTGKTVSQSTRDKLSKMFSTPEYKEKYRVQMTVTQQKRRAEKALLKSIKPSTV